MPFFPKAVNSVLLLGNCNGVPLNVEVNRYRMSAAFKSDGDASMTPAMCGFYLQALALDTSTDAFKKARIVANSIHATFEEGGMPIHFAMAAALRVKTEQPKLFAEMAEVHCPRCGGTCVELPQETVST